MEQYIFIGLDIAKDKFDAAIMIKGKYINAVFVNSIAGFKKLKQWIEKHAVSTPWVCLEATGAYSTGVAEYLFNQNIKVSVCNPLQIKNYAKSYLTRNKNDILDAKIIRAYGQERKPLCFKPAPESQKYVKGLTQLINTLEKQKQELLNQVSSIQIDSVQKEFKKLIKNIEKQVKIIESKLKNYIAKNDDQNAIKERIKTVKGLGDRTAHTLIAFLPNIDDFKNAKQLAAYVGVSPKQHQSGKFAGKTTLSKIGNASIRKALYMPAIVVKNTNPHFKAFCQRLEKNGLKPKAIVGALMRKLIYIIFGMLKNKQDFNPALV